MFPSRGKVVEVNRGNLWEVLERAFIKIDSGRIEMSNQNIRCWCEIKDGKIIAIAASSSSDISKGSTAVKYLLDLLEEEGIYRIIRLSEHEIEFDMKSESESILAIPLTIDHLRILATLRENYEVETIRTIEVSLNPLLSIGAYWDDNTDESDKGTKIIFYGTVTSPIVGIAKLKNRSFKNPLMLEFDYGDEVSQLVLWEGVIKIALYLSSKSVCAGTEAVTKVEALQKVNMKAKIIPLEILANFLLTAAHGNF